MKQPSSPRSQYSMTMIQMHAGKTEKKKKRLEERCPSRPVDGKTENSLDQRFKAVIARKFQPPCRNGGIAKRQEKPHHFVTRDTSRREVHTERRRRHEQDGRTDEARKTDKP